MKKSKMKKKALVLHVISLLLLMACSGNVRTKYGQTEEPAQLNDEVVVEINESTFPDDAFRTFLLSKEYGSDGKLTQNELSSISQLLVSIKKIESLKGVEHFTSLKKLDCSMNKLTSLDVSNLHNLETLSCYNNNLTELNLANNSKLEILYCGQNKLTTLDVSENPCITLISFEDNSIKGDAMDRLIQSLPKASTSSTYYFTICGHDSEQETNKWTKKQLGDVRAKGWTPYNMKGEEL